MKERELGLFVIACLGLAQGIIYKCKKERLAITNQDSNDSTIETVATEPQKQKLGQSSIKSYFSCIVFEGISKRGVLSGAIVTLSHFSFANINFITGRSVQMNNPLSWQWVAEFIVLTLIFGIGWRILVWHLLSRKKNR
jgi:hypothetical protein